MKGLRKTRRRCQDLVRALDVPWATDVRALCGGVARLRRRPINLLPMSFPDGALCGLWIASDAADYLVYEQATSAVHQEHIVLHELGHLLCDHDAGGSFEVELFHHLDPEAVLGMMGRTNYSTVEEQEAELVASLLRGHCGLDERPRAFADRDLDRRLQRMFGYEPSAGG